MKSIPITLLMFFYFCLNTIEAQSQPYKRICVIGSSTSWGYFNGMYPRDSGYAFKLSKYYQSLNLIDTLYNIAVNGSDPYFGMPSSYTPPAGRDAPDGRYNITKAVNFIPKPDVIIVNYPSNHYDYFTYSEVLFCLQTIKDSANAKGIVCYITTTQPRDNFNTYEREKLAVLRDSILNRFGDFAIDFYDPIVQNPDMIIRPEYSLGDGVHTNPAGQTVLENAVIDKNILFKALPLAFFSVSGHKNENAIEINWSINGGRNTLFSIERSQDGLNFVKIGTVNFLEGKMDYQFVDLNVAHVNNYYRIIGIDQDNKKTYSKIIRVNYNEKTFVNIFYDQTTQDLHLLSVQNNLTNPIILYIFDQSGKTVLKKIFPINNSREYEVNMSDLPKSIYSVIVISGNMKISKNIKN